MHYSKSKEEYVPGSPIKALEINPPFKEYHLIDLDSEKADFLKGLSKTYKNVSVYNGDCNNVLLKSVFPRCQYKEYKRALCLLDPYGLHLNWEVIETAGKMKSIEIFLNFPVADINRNVLWNDPKGVDEGDLNRMNAFWGDESWREVAYETEGNLFGLEEKTNNITFARAFQERLKKVDGFSFVPDPIPMRNSKSAIVYYLFFASHKPASDKIVKDILNKYRNKGKK